MLCHLGANLPGWLHGIKPPKLHIAFQKAAGSYHIPPPPKAAVTGLQQDQNEFSSTFGRCFEKGQYNCNSNSPRFCCVPEQSGMRPFPLLAPWERFPQPVSVLHDHSRQHDGTHCLVHSPTYTAGLTMEHTARGHGCPYNT